MGGRGPPAASGKAASGTAVRVTHRSRCQQRTTNATHKRGPAAAEGSPEARAATDGCAARISRRAARARNPAAYLRAAPRTSCSSCARWPCACSPRCAAAAPPGCRASGTCRSSLGAPGGGEWGWGGVGVGLEREWLARGGGGSTRRRRGGWWAGGGGGGGVGLGEGGGGSTRKRRGGWWDCGARHTMEPLPAGGQPPA